MASSRNKTGGGPGSNQHGPKGTSKRKDPAGGVSRSVAGRLKEAASRVAAEAEVQVEGRFVPAGRGTAIGPNGPKNSPWGDAVYIALDTETAEMDANGKSTSKEVNVHAELYNPLYIPPASIPDKTDYLRGIVRAAAEQSEEMPPEVQRCYDEKFGGRNMYPADFVAEHGQQIAALDRLAELEADEIANGASPADAPRRAMKRLVNDEFGFDGALVFEGKPSLNGEIGGNHLIAFDTDSVQQA